MSNKKQILLSLTIIVILGLVYLLLTNRTVAPVISTELPKQTQETIPEENKTLTVTLYFPNGRTDPGFMDCSVVRPTTRTIPYTQAIATATIQELINGPTDQEKQDGFVTQLDTRTTIQSLSITDGVARIDLSKELAEKSVGLCAGQFIEAQIKQTLLQFQTVQKVVVSIDGDTEFVQP